MEKIEDMLTPARRKYLYRVSAAAAALAAMYGLINGDETMGLLALFAAVFGVADRNVTA